jgi:hypothetical protein
MPFGPAIPSLLLAAFFVHALVYVIRASTLPHRMGSTASCGRCGYAYSGLARCPECGSDVASAGVLTPRLALRLRGGWLSVAIALLVVVSIGAIPVVPTLSALSTSLGYRRTHVDCSLHPTVSLANLAAGGYEIEMVEDLVSRGGPAVSGAVTVAISTKPLTPARGNWIAASGLPRAEIDAGTGAVRLYDARGATASTHTTFDGDASAALYSLSGLDLSDAEVRTACQNLARHIQTELRTPGAGLTKPAVATVNPAPGTLSFGGSGTTTGAGFPFMFLGLSGESEIAALVALGTALVYAVALAAIVRRRRRLIRG